VKAWRARRERRAVVTGLAAGTVCALIGVAALWGALGLGAGVDGLLPWQGSKLQRLLITCGVWLVAAGISVVLSFGLKLHVSRPAAPEIPFRNSRRASSIALAILVASFVVAYGWLSVERHHRFASTGYDLAINEQVVWNTVHGRFFATSVEVDNRFADHFQPLMLGLVPLYALFPRTELLLLLQVCAVAAAAIPLYRLARRRLGDARLALSTVAAYLMYPAVGFVVRFDFHLEAIAIAALIAAFDALDRGHLRSASIWLLLPLLSKEDLGLAVAAVGLYAAIAMRRLRFGLCWAGVGLVVTVATMFWLIPTVRGAASDTLARYAWLGDTPGQMATALVTRPRDVWRMVGEPSRLLYLLQLLVPNGLLALLGLPELVMAVPALIINALAEHHCQAKIYCQYSVPIIPFVFVATTTGLQRLRKVLVGRRTLWLILGMVVLPLTGAALAIDNPFMEAQDLPAPLARLPNGDAVKRALSIIPPDALVVTTNAYAPHLARREGLYIIGIPGQRDPPPDPDIVFINLYDQRYMVCAQYREYFEQLETGRYGVIYRDSGLIVVQRDGGSGVGFVDFVENWTDCAG
jgi:uncharacterized membrane protein